jgi:branched-chain amino acid transport system substrate-binding protein
MRVRARLGNKRDPLSGSVSLTLQPLLSTIGLTTSAGATEVDRHQGGGDAMVYRRSLLFVWISSISLVIAGCGSGDGGSSASSAGSTPGGTSAPAASGAPATTGGGCADGEIIMGEARAQTGSFSLFDVEAANGNQLAFDEANASGGLLGCKITVVSGDTKSDPALGGRVAQELIDKGAQFLFSPGDFDIGVGSAQAGENAGLVGIAEAASLDMPDAAGDHFFASGVATEAQGYAQAAFAKEKGWKTSYNVINEQFAFFTDKEAAFKSKYEGEIVGRDVVADTATDYSAVISKIRDAPTKPDVIYLGDYFPHVGTFIKQLRDAGVETPVLGDNSMSALDLPSVVGKERMSQVFYVASVFWEGKDADPGVAKVLADYKAKFGKGPVTNNFMNGYYSATYVMEGIKAAGSTDADAVAKAMNEQADLEMPGATLTRWVDRNAQITLVVVGFDDAGEFIQVKAPFDPQKT